MNNFHYNQDPLYNTIADILKNDVVTESANILVPSKTNKDLFIKVESNGTVYYYADKAMKVLHNPEGPAILSKDGYKAWYKNGDLHNDKGPAVEFANGDKEWYLNDKLHRVDGPAIVRAGGGYEWYENDKLHNTKGPAVEYSNGTKEWWVKGRELTDDQFYAKYGKKESYQTDLETLEEGLEQIVSAVASFKKGDKTNFGVVTDIGSNSISFKAKDLPITKIAFNQRKMGSKDFVLDKLAKLKEGVELEEGSMTANMGTATITAPGNKLHGKQVSIFHKFDDGRLNVQYIKSNKKGDILNLTLNKGQYKFD